MILSTPYDNWWCCLNPRERNAIKLLTAAFFANSEYIKQSDYTVIAFVTGLAGLTQVNQYFLDHYGLTSGIILGTDDEPIAVYFFDTEMWAAFYSFSFSNNYLCTSPCEAFEFWT